MEKIDSVCYSFGPIKELNCVDSHFLSNTSTSISCQNILKSYEKMFKTIFLTRHSFSKGRCVGRGGKYPHPRFLFYSHSKKKLL